MPYKAQQVGYTGTVTTPLKQRQNIFGCSMKFPNLFPASATSFSPTPSPPLIHSACLFSREVLSAPGRTPTRRSRSPKLRRVSHRSMHERIQLLYLCILAYASISRPKHLFHRLFSLPRDISWRTIAFRLACYHDFVLSWRLP